MTEKLYYVDAYMKEFSATVVSSELRGGSYVTVLDKTAFFPNEGGQNADGGRVGAARVLDVKESDGVIYHYLSEPVAVGQEVFCSLDFSARFDKMQQHTAEHILSGIINRLYGFDNVGFHLGDDEVTFDINGVLTREELDYVEELANKAVFDNLSVRAYFPTESELADITYRSKLDLESGVRIVDIDGVDTCACCAPHVSKTGEIGCIKILDFMKWRGGLRMNIAAGSRALRDYRERYTAIKYISALLSAEQSAVPQAVEALKSAYEEEKSKTRELYMSLAGSEADKIKLQDGNLVLLLPDMPMNALIELSNRASGKVRGLLVLLTGRDGDFKYVISSPTQDLSAEVKKINTALLGKGGGRGNMIQGSFATDIASIREYFK